MINMFVLLVTCGLCAYVVYRAVMLDRSLPWFGQPPAPDAEAPEADPDKVAIVPAPSSGWRTRAASAGRRRSSSA